MNLLSTFIRTLLHLFTAFEWKAKGSLPESKTIPDALESKYKSSDITSIDFNQYQDTMQTPIFPHGE